jgi:hypothetical protein
MELDGRFYIGKSFFIGLALSYYYPFNSDLVGYIAIKMLFYSSWITDLRQEAARRRMAARTCSPEGAPVRMGRR